MDDDCDGLIDEDVVIDDGGTLRALADGIACSTRGGMLDITPATPAVGACAYGTLLCDASGQLACQAEALPHAELCDNVDQDCDGAPVPSNLSNLTIPKSAVVCSNQLGICGTGTPGRTVCVNSGTAGSPNWHVQCSAGSVTPQTETCDGEDDDCDGRFDEAAVGVGNDNCQLVDNNNDGVRETYVGTPLDTGECQSGDTYCSGGRLACVGSIGPRAETCNGRNDDCDTGTDEDAQFVGTACNVLSGTIGSANTWNLLGACTPGTWSCPADPATAATTGLQCMGGTRPAASETCNGIDDDCDGRVDEQWVATGGQPQPDPRAARTIHRRRTSTCATPPARLTRTAGRAPTSAPAAWSRACSRASPPAPRFATRAARSSTTIATATSTRATGTAAACTRTSTTAAAAARRSTAARPVIRSTTRSWPASPASVRS